MTSRIVTVATAALLLSTNAYSQTDDASTAAGEEGGLQEVTVTAERYGATVQTTPVAVTAFSPEVLEERQVTNVLQAASEIPGIVIVPNVNSNNSARIVLRGAGQENSGINFDQAVGVYIDDIYQPRVNGAFFEFFDVGRVEVLRGPQGTLYGRNTSGGALKIESSRPSFDWKGGLEAGVGNWNALHAKGYVSGPLIEDKLAFSVSGVHKERDGFLWGVNYNDHVGDVESGAQRVKLLYTPSENLDIWLTAHAIQDYSESSVGVPLTVPMGVVNPNATGAGRDLTITENLGELGQPFLYNDGASFHVTYTRGAAQVNFISGYGNLRTYSDGGALLFLSAAAQTAFANGTQTPAGTNEGRSRTEWLSQELNTTYTSDRIKAVGGVYYYDEEGMSRSLVLDSPTIDQDRGVEAYAVFAQGTYMIGGGVGLTAGARYTSEKADFTQFFRLQNNAAQSDSKTFTATTPKLGVNWQITPDLLTYASWTKGFKSGGFNPVPPNSNTGVPGQIGAPTPYGPENVDSYEVGVKFTTTDNRLRVNLAAFQADYDGMQLPVFFPGTTTSYTSNASGAKVRGIELEPAWQVADPLQLYGNFSFTSGEYTEPFLCSGANTLITDCQDKKLKALVPEKWTVGVRFAPQLPLPGKLTFNGQWLHHSKYYNNVSNEGPLVQTGEANLYNASLHWADDDGRWKASIEGRNLANKHYVLHAIQLANLTQPAVTGYPNTPREFMVRLGVQF